MIVSKSLVLSFYLKHRGARVWLRNNEYFMWNAALILSCIIHISNQVSDSMQHDRRPQLKAQCLI